MTERKILYLVTHGEHIYEVASREKLVKLFTNGLKAFYLTAKSTLDITHEKEVQFFRSFKVYVANPDETLSVINADKPFMEAKKQVLIDPDVRSACRRDAIQRISTLTMPSNLHYLPDNTLEQLLALLEGLQQ